MKNLIKKSLIALTLVTSFNVTAEETTKEQDICEITGTAAENLMEARQGGVRMSVMMNKIDPMIHFMVIAAYEEPQWSGESRKKSAISDFANKMELACYKNQSK